MFEEIVIAEFSLGSVKDVEYRVKVAVRSGELCVDIRKFRNGHPMPQGVQLPVRLAKQLFKQGPAILRTIGEYRQAGLSSTASGVNAQSRSKDNSR